MSRLFVPGLLLPALLIGLLLDGPAAAAPCPNVMLVLDQSASMAEDPLGHDPFDPEFRAPSKWELLQQAATDLVKKYGDRLPLGLVLFSGNHNIRVPDDDNVCYAQTMTTASVKTGTAGTITNAIRNAQPMGNSGTNGAIHAARLDPGLKDAATRNVILLITDSNPNCGTDARQLNAAENLSRTGGGGTLDEIHSAYAQQPSIRTYVVGFDGDARGVNIANLDIMGFEGRE